MIAIAWTDTKDGRWWVARRGVLLLVVGAATAALGWFAVGRSLMSIGVGLALLGAWSIGWAILHADRGLPPPQTSKPCVVPGCSGTMTLDERHRARVLGAHSRKWVWHSSWRCSQDSTHVEVITDAPVLRRVCVVDDCHGFMVLRHPRLDCDLTPAHWEWPWYATWVCEQNSAHVQVIPDSEYAAEIRRLFRRE